MAMQEGIPVRRKGSHLDGHADYRSGRSEPSNTRFTVVSIHPIIEAAAGGTLPSWAVAGEERRAHMARVADLLGAWAEARGMSEADRIRWRSVGFLHDVLRDEDPDRLRSLVPPVVADLPPSILHGPAGAERLRVDGVLDGPILRAVAWHTAGDPDFDTLGRALYAADFLEPGRVFEAEWRAELRARMPDALDDVVQEIVRARIQHLLAGGRSVLPRTLAFWNALAEVR